MQVSKLNDVKVYNLSAGKSLPQWITERKRRNLERKDVDIRRRIQLIQDFEMPCVSNSVAITPDRQYVYASGSYKPTIRCYDVNDLSLKFERGIDADVVKLLPLSDDFSKLVLLQQGRYVEFHARFGRYFRLRIPREGRDMTFCREASDLCLVGASNEVYRLNLEQGCFLNPLSTEAEYLNCVDVNDWHQLIVCGGSNATVEAFDHRDRNRVGVLNCALQQLQNECILPGTVPEVTSVKFKDPLTLAVGTSTGHVLIYDIRARSPKLVKNHNLGLPITCLDFVSSQNLALSMDSRALKVWSLNDGKPFTAIEPGTKLTQFVRYPDSGLIFFANDAPRMLQYFIPSLGLAPKWCHYLDNVTEELEETEAPVVYDDYKFVTKEELEGVGLTNLIGSTLLRAYMHGYFIDVRLYNKAKTLTQPFAFERYKNRKLQEKLDEERELTVLAKKTKLPVVNKELASKLQKKLANELLSDDRFKNLFVNPDFEVDKESEQYQHIVTKLQKQREKTTGKAVDSEDEDEFGNGDYDDESQEERNLDNADLLGNLDISEDESVDEGEEDMDDSEGEPVEPKQIKTKDETGKLTKRNRTFKFVGLESSRDFMAFVPNQDEEDPFSVTHGTMRDRKKQLGSMNREDVVESMPFGGKSMTFTMKPEGKSAEALKRESNMQKHIAERKALRRSAGSVMRHLKPLPSELHKKKMAALKAKKR